MSFPYWQIQKLIEDGYSIGWGISMMDYIDF